MGVYSISYDLRNSDKDYEGLYKAIKSRYSWCHSLESTWLIETYDTAPTIFNNLKSHIDSNDLIFISRITTDYYGRLPEEAWEWLKKRGF